MQYETDDLSVALGRKIRALRQRLKRTLDDTATAAGISKPFLSQVERGMASPSLTSLSGIARSLGVTVQYFLDTPSEERTICRSGNQKFFCVTKSSNLLARITNSTQVSKMESILVRMPPRRPCSEVTTHAGEEFIYIVEGQLSLTLEERKFELQAGDSAHYESTLPHSWENIGLTETVIVWVGTQKLF